MANNYYDATGVLVLDQITPVITALFSGLKLDASYPGDGEVYIALIAEEGGAHWDDICEDLVSLAQSLGLSVPNEGTPTMNDVLAVLSGHFGADQDEELQNLIEQHRFEDGADLDALFLIATRFDDGHNLQEIRFESCWYCSKPRLFNFGGEGSFISREFTVFGNSGQVLKLGSDIRQALLIHDLEAAANLFSRETQRLLAGIADETQRQQLQRRLSELLC